jgi:hypothetical protein
MEAARLGRALQLASAELASMRQMQAGAAEAAEAAERAVKELVADRLACSEDWARVAVHSGGGTVEGARDWLRDRAEAEAKVAAAEVQGAESIDGGGGGGGGGGAVWDAGLALGQYSNLQPAETSDGLGSACDSPVWRATHTTFSTGGGDGPAVQTTRRVALKALRLADVAAIDRLARLLGRLRRLPGSVGGAGAGVWAPTAAFRTPVAGDEEPAHDVGLAAASGLRAQQALCDAYLELPYQPSARLATLADWMTECDGTDDGVLRVIVFFQRWLQAVATLHAAGVAPVSAAADAGVCVLRGAIDGSETDTDNERPLVTGAVWRGMLEPARAGGDGGVLPPEVATGGRNWTSASDVYIVGHWLYRALFGREPVLLPGRRGPEFPAVLPPQLLRCKQLLREMLDEEAEHRPTATAAAAAGFFSGGAAVEALEEAGGLVRLELRQQLLRAHIHALRTDGNGRDTRRGGAATQLTIRRGMVVDSVLQAFGALEMGNQSKLLLPLRVVFAGEPGVDAGGLTKEMWTLFGDDLFDQVRCSLLEPADPPPADRRFLPRPQMEAGDAGREDAAEVFAALGRVLVKVLVDEVPLAIPLAPSVFRFLLGPFSGPKEVDYTMTDYAAFDPAAARGCAQLLELEDAESLYLTFDAGDGLGEVDVTNANRDAYISWKIRWDLEGVRRPELEALRRGFQTVAGLRDHLALFAPAELTQLFCPTLPVLTPVALLDCTEFTGFQRGSPAPGLFRQVVGSWSETALRRLLRFVTAQDTLPRDANSGGGKIKVACQQGAEDETLPVAHTCFNRLDMPPYPDLDTMRARLQFCVDNLDNAGFGEA